MKRIIIIAASGTASFFMPIALLKIMFIIANVPLILVAKDVVGLTIIGVWAMLVGIVFSSILTNEGENQ